MSGTSRLCLSAPAESLLLFEYFFLLTPKASRHADGSSRNRTQTSRYVYFASFYHPSARWLVRDIRRKRYRDAVPGKIVGHPEMLRRLPPGVHGLLDY